jgi:pimeloyl-ACP methyl ester carboxylesterase
MNKTTHPIAIDGVNTVYYKKGKGKKLIVLPGWRTDVERISEGLDYFSQYFETYYVNLPGYGDESYDKKFTFEDTVKFLEDWIQKLDLDQFSLLGISMSGPIAYYLAKKPSLTKKVNKVILLAPWYKEKFILIPNWQKIFARGMVELGTWPLLWRLGQSAYKNEEFIMRFIRRLSPEVPWDESLRAHARNYAKFSFRATSYSMKNLFYVDLDNETEQIKSPAIFIMSANDEQLDFSKTRDGYKRLFPQLETIALKHKFHAPRTWVSKELIEKYFGDAIKMLTSQ